MAIAGVFLRGLDVLRSRISRCGPLSPGAKADADRYVTRCARAADFYHGQINGPGPVRGKARPSSVGGPAPLRGAVRSGGRLGVAALAGFCALGCHVNQWERAASAEARRRSRSAAPPTGTMSVEAPVTDIGRLRQSLSSAAPTDRELAVQSLGALRPAAVAALRPC